MFNIVLVEPEIPPNTGNIIRLCANTGCSLHLVKPLGFDLEHAKLRRAGLDYREWTDIQVYENYEEFASCRNQERVFTFSKLHRYQYSDAHFKPGDIFVFGSETRGLPETVRLSVDRLNQLKIPMLPGNRSLNLSNAVAVAVYEAWRQNRFKSG